MESSDTVEEPRGFDASFLSELQLGIQELADRYGSPSAGLDMAFLVYLTLWTKTSGRARTRVRMSLRTLAEETGLSKRAVQLAVQRLVKRRLVSATRGSITAVPEYAVLKPWRRG